MALAPCNKSGQGKADILLHIFEKKIVNFMRFAIIKAWKHFGNRKSASQNKLFGKKGTSCTQRY